MTLHIDTLNKYYTGKQIKDLATQSCPGCQSCKWVDLISGLRCEECEFLIAFVPLTFDSSYNNFKFDRMEIGDYDVYYIPPRTTHSGYWLCVSDHYRIELPEFCNAPDLEKLVRKCKQLILLT
jgi:hypothetical protein